MNNQENKQKSEFVVFLKKIFVQNLAESKDQVVDGVIVPQIKSFLSNLSSSLINNILYGRDNIRQNNKRNYSYNYPIDQINYNSINPNQIPYNSQNTIKPIAYGVGNLTSIRFEVGEGEVILEKMRDIISQYGKVSAADFYDLVNEDRIGVNPQLPRLTVDPMSYNYGWTDLSSAKVIRTNTDSFYIEFPKCVPMN